MSPSAPVTGRNRVRPTVRALVLSGLAVVASLAIALAPAMPAWLAPLPLAGVLAAMAADFALSPLPRPVTVRATAPAETFVGTDLALRVALHHPRGLPKAVRCQIAPMDGLRPRDGEGDGEAGVWTVAARDGTAVWTMAAVRRGRHRPGPVHIRWNGRLGLLEMAAIRALDIDFATVPDVRPITSGAIELELRSALFGQKRTAQRGEGSEFHQLTDFATGMDPRAIDWKRSATARRLVARETRAENNHHVVLAIDQGRLMREEVGGLPKLDHGVHAALAVSWAALRHGDLVGAMAFDHRPRLWLPPRGGTGQFARLRAASADLAYGGREANHVLALTRLHQSLSRRSLVVVLSDFAEPLSAELIGEHLAALRRHHVVVFAVTADPWLRRLAAAPAASTQEMARAVAADTWLAERAAMLERMAATGVRVVEAAPGALTPRLLSAYLDIVAREVV